MTRTAPDARANTHCERNVRTMVFGDECERQIDARSHARRRHQLAIAQINAVVIDARFRKLGGVLGRMLPLFGDVACIEQARMS